MCPACLVCLVCLAATLSHAHARLRMQYAVGEMVLRRDTGKDWGQGFVTQTFPLKVTAKSDPTADGFAWDEVKPVVSAVGHHHGRPVQPLGQITAASKRPRVRTRTRTPTRTPTLGVGCVARLRHGPSVTLLCARALVRMLVLDCPNGHTCVC